jgi:hypothetical protein
LRVRLVALAIGKNAARRRNRSTAHAKGYCVVTKRVARAAGPSLTLLFASNGDCRPFERLKRDLNVPFGPNHPKQLFSTDRRTSAEQQRAKGHADNYQPPHHAGTVQRADLASTPTTNFCPISAALPSHNALQKRGERSDRDVMKPLVVV